MNVDDIIFVEADSKVKSIDFEINGEAIAQNGWKLAFRGRVKPYLFDPLKKEKTELRKMIDDAITSYGVKTPIFTKADVAVKICFGLARVSSKDLDNMAKFLLDTLEGAIYDDDKFIIDLHLKKATVVDPKMTISITSIIN